MSLSRSPCLSNKASDQYNAIYISWTLAMMHMVGFQLIKATFYCATRVYHVESSALSVGRRHLAKVQEK